MAASCTNADVLATVIQKLGGLTLKDGQILALNSLNSLNSLQTVRSFVRFYFRFKSQLPFCENHI